MFKEGDIVICINDNVVSYDSSYGKFSDGNVSSCSIKLNNKFKILNISEQYVDILDIKLNRILNNILAERFKIDVAYIRKEKIKTLYKSQNPI